MGRGPRLISAQAGKRDAHPRAPDRDHMRGSPPTPSAGAWSCGLGNHWMLYLVCKKGIVVYRLTLNPKGQKAGAADFAQNIARFINAAQSRNESGCPARLCILPITNTVPSGTAKMETLHHSQDNGSATGASCSTSPFTETVPAWIINVHHIAAPANDT